MGLQSKLYINGKLDKTLWSTSLVQYSRQDLVFGVDYRDNNGYLVGTMDNINVWGSSLSDAVILALYNANPIAPSVAISSRTRT